MIRASELYGRAVVDLETAEKIGTIDELIVDTDAPCVAGYVVVHGYSLFSRGKRILIPSEAVHAIGPDALTIEQSQRFGITDAYLDSLPRLSELTGRRMISRGGRLLGVIEEALMDERDGRIIGYPLDGVRLAPGLERLFGVGGLGSASEPVRYVRADADLRLGSRIVVVPDEAVAVFEDETLPPPSDDVDGMAAEIPAPRDSRLKKRRSPQAVEAPADVPAIPAPPMMPSWEDLAIQRVEADESEAQEGDTTPMTRPSAVVVRRRRQA